MDKSTVKSASYYKTLCGIKDEELVVLKEQSAKLSPKMEEVTDKFHAWLEERPNYYTRELIEAVKMNKQALWDDIILYQLDEEFVFRQNMFGQAFAGMGVAIENYLAAIISYHQFVEKAFESEGLMTLELASIFKKFTLAMTAIVTDTYNEATNKTLIEQNRVLMEMSTPVTRLWDGILLLPLVGFIDSKRAQDTMTKMLGMITQTQAKIFILDISGIAVVDTAVANYLIKMTKATRLMGCVCIISGISGTVAQTIVELGVQIDEVETTGNMQDALKNAFDKTGAEIQTVAHS